MGRPKFIHPWEQQDKEPNLQYAHFLKFLGLAREERTALEAFYLAYPDKNAKRAADPQYRPPGSWYEMVNKWRWRQRALAWDREQDRLFLRAMEARRQRSLAETADLGEALRKRAMQAARLLTSVEQSIGERDGRPVIVLKSNISPDQIVRMADIGVKIEQLALGHPTERLSHGDDPENPLGAAALEDAKESLRKRLEEIRERRLSAARRVAEDRTREEEDKPDVVAGSEELDGNWEVPSGEKPGA